MYIQQFKVVEELNNKHPKKYFCSDHKEITSIYDC